MPAARRDGFAAMTWIKAALLAILLLILVVVGLLLGIDNHTQVSLRFLNKESPSIAVFWWLYAAFLGGVAAGFALCFAGLLRSKVAQRRLKRTLADRDRQLTALRGKAGEENAPGT